MENKPRLRKRVMDVIVTTGLEPTDETLAHARELAKTFGLPVTPRGDASLEQLRRRHGVESILVVSAKGARLEMPNQSPFFFHPNNAAFRIKRLERGDTDTMLLACQIQPGDQVLDATLGLGADAIVFSYAVGVTGQVVGVESQPLIAYLVADGLLHWTDGSEAMIQAMRRVEVRLGHHYDVLRELPDRSFDVVYFDPMFEQTVQASSGISGLRLFANAEVLAEKTVQEALRVARRRVVLKEGQSGKLYERLGFTPFRNRERQAVYSFRERNGGE